MRTPSFPLQELAIKQLQQELMEDREDMRQVQHKIEDARNIGKSSWEITGINTIPYRDPFHTGLSKRTPTGGYFTS